MSAGDTCERESCTATVQRRRGDSDAQAAGRRFCSLSCYRAHVHVEGLTRTCEMCGEVFGPSKHERPGQFVKRNPLFCSRACSGAAKTARHPKGVPHCTVCRREIAAKPGDSPGQHARRRRCPEHPRVAAVPSAGPRAAKPQTRKAPARPREVSPFGDRPPAHVWRPAGFSAAPRTRVAS